MFLDVYSKYTCIIEDIDTHTFVLFSCWAHSVDLIMFDFSSIVYTFVFKGNPLLHISPSLRNQPQMIPDMSFILLC